MAPIRSGAALNVIRETMGLQNGQLREQGERIAYIVYSMLQRAGGCSEKQGRLAAIIALLQNIGDLMEVGEAAAGYDPVWVRSASGYYLMKEFSPFYNYSDVILYGQLPPEKISEMDFRGKDLAMVFSFANQVDALFQKRGGQLGSAEVETALAPHYPGGESELFCAAQESGRVLQHLADGSYRPRVDAIIRESSWSQRISDRLVGFLSNSIDFRTEETVGRTLAANITANYLAERFNLSGEKLENLQYASLVYDVGMVGVPKEIKDKKGPLTVEEKVQMQQHVTALESVLKPFVPAGIYDIAASHHERLDGKGYVLGLPADELPFTHRLLMVADVFAAIHTNRPYHQAMHRAGAVKLLEKEAQKNRLDKDVIRQAVTHYDDIMRRIRRDCKVFKKEFKAVQGNLGGLLEGLAQKSGAV